MNDLMYHTPLPMPAVMMQQALYPVQDFVALPEFSFLTESSMRHLIFNSRSRYSASGEKIQGNGLVESGAIIRIGRRVLIDAAKFREWMLSHRETIDHT